MPRSVAGVLLSISSYLCPGNSPLILVQTVVLLVYDMNNAISSMTDCH